MIRTGIFIILFVVIMAQSGKLIFLRCHAFASHINAKKRMRCIYRSNIPIFRGGGDGNCLPNQQQSTIQATSTKTTSLYSTVSPSNPAPPVSENERIMETLTIAGGVGAGAITSTSMLMKSFGGIPYRDTSSLSKAGDGQGSSPFRVVFVLGGPGAGKGTQCELLTQNYPCVHLSAGQLLREEAEKKDGSSESATLIKECLVRGQIVPVEISLSLLQKAMREASVGNDSQIFLIDGFPRNFDNLDGWTRYMTKSDDMNDNTNSNDVSDTDTNDSDASVVWGVLFYDCPLPVLEKRVMERSKDSGRSDDNLESLRKRFKTFQAETVPVIDTLKEIEKKSSSLLRVIDIQGQESKEKVWEESQKSMNSFIQNDVLSANLRLLEAISINDVDHYRNLCDNKMFSDVDVHKNNNENSDRSIMTIQEGGENDTFKEIIVNCAEMTFITPKKVSVSYDRTSNSGVTFRETRIWSFQGSKGWRMIHFFRV